MPPRDPAQEDLPKINPDRSTAVVLTLCRPDETSGGKVSRSKANERACDGCEARQVGSPPLRFDVIAGLTAAAVVLPKAMAYATVAGLPVAVGLYTAFVPMAVYALLGSSRVLSVSSTATLAILTVTQLGLVVPDGDPARLVTATATLTALVGAMLILARLMRLGFVANFISAPVLTGFKAGIGLVIVLDQVPKLLGVHITKQGFFADVLERPASRFRHFSADPCHRRGDVCGADRHGTAVAPFTGPAGRRRRRHRRIVVLRSERTRGLDGRTDPAGTPSARRCRMLR